MKISYCLSCLCESPRYVDRLLLWYLCCLLKQIDCSVYRVGKYMSLSVGFKYEGEGESPWSR